MEYSNMAEGIFLSRPNRFIAHCAIDGAEYVCHVKNTGRCRELLVPGARVLLQKAANPLRKTPYDLISVQKDGQLINIDSQAPNTVFGEWLRNGGLGFVPQEVKPEHTYRNSRFDFYFEHEGKKAFAEVKGVTLKAGSTALFPDAPTERGAKHMAELRDCVLNGYEAYAVFIIQMKGVDRLSPNVQTDPDFARALAQAQQAGVKLLALDCIVTENSLTVDRPVEVVL